MEFSSAVVSISANPYEGPREGLDCDSSSGSLLAEQLGLSTALARRHQPHTTSWSPLPPLYYHNVMMRERRQDQTGKLPILIGWTRCGSEDRDAIVPASTSSQGALLLLSSAPSRAKLVGARISRHGGWLRASIGPGQRCTYTVYDDERRRFKPKSQAVENARCRERAVRRFRLSTAHFLFPLSARPREHRIPHRLLGAHVATYAQHCSNRGHGERD